MHGAKARRAGGRACCCNVILYGLRACIYIYIYIYIYIGGLPTCACAVLYVCVLDAEAVQVTDVVYIMLQLTRLAYSHVLVLIFMMSGTAYRARCVPCTVCVYTLQRRMACLNL